MILNQTRDFIVNMEQAKNVSTSVSTSASAGASTCTSASANVSTSTGANVTASTGAKASITVEAITSRRHYYSTDFDEYDNMCRKFSQYNGDDDYPPANDYDYDADWN